MIGNFLTRLFENILYKLALSYFRMYLEIPAKDDGIKTCICTLSIRFHISIIHNFLKVPRQKNILKFPERAQVISGVWCTDVHKYMTPRRRCSIHKCTFFCIFDKLLLAEWSITCIRAYHKYTKCFAISPACIYSLTYIYICDMSACI